MQLNIQPLKEPRGFIRVLQCLFAILAFATTTSYDNRAEVEIKCTEIAGDKHVHSYSSKYELEYPFNVAPRLHFPISSKDIPCPPKTEEGKTFAPIPIAESETIDKSTTAEFYVTTGVLAFLYSLAAIFVYVFLDTLYLNAPILPFFDLVATGILTLFWFLGWCSWVAQWGNVKEFYYNLPGIVCGELTLKEDPLVHTLECNNIGDVKFAKLTISLIFGFANIILWAGSSWFVFKETSFHTKTEMQASYINPDAAANNHRQQQQHA